MISALLCRYRAFGVIYCSRRAGTRTGTAPAARRRTCVGRPGAPRGPCEAGGTRSRRRPPPRHGRRQGCHKAGSCPLGRRPSAPGLRRVMATILDIGSFRDCESPDPARGVNGAGRARDLGRPGRRQACCQRTQTNLNCFKPTYHNDLPDKPCRAPSTPWRGPCFYAALVLLRGAQRAQAPFRAGASSRVGYPDAG